MAEPKRTKKKPAAAPAQEPAPGADENVLHDRIQQRAYQLWEGEGRPNGRGDAHWQQAEREIREEMAGAPTRATPREDTTGAVAPPKKARRPGSSAELGGTPGAAATSSSGRQTPSPRRGKVSRSSSS